MFFLFLKGYYDYFKLKSVILQDVYLHRFSDDLQEGNSKCFIFFRAFSIFLIAFRNHLLPTKHIFMDPKQV